MRGEARPLSPHSPNGRVEGKVRDEYLSIDIFCSEVTEARRVGQQGNTMSVPPAESGLETRVIFYLRFNDLRPNVVALPAKL